MGDRLAKEVEAIYKARPERSDEWQVAMKEGLTIGNAPAFLVEVTAALQEALVYLAREVDDPPRLNET